LIQVVDHYDALVMPSEDSPGLSPVKVLERLLMAAGQAFDPVMVKALMLVVGRYPYGSLVRLSTGEVGVVSCGMRDEATFEKPTVVVVRDGEGNEVEAREVDLANSWDGERSIVEVLDPFTDGVVAHAELFGDLSQEVDWDEEGVEMEIDDDDDDDYDDSGEYE
jgi:hypothetical protein